MKTMLILALMLLSLQAAFTQNKTEKTLTYSLSFDTILKPDYFIIEMVVAEYWKMEGKGKKSTPVLVPLDTVSKDLTSELNRLGFSGHPTEKSITEKNNRTDGERAYFYNRPLFQATHQLNLTNRDSINYLFKEITKDNLVSFIVTPKFYDATPEKAKEKLFVRALNAAKDYAQKVAESNNIKIIKQSNIHLGFGPDRDAYNSTYNSLGRLKEFNIDLSDVRYQLTTTYTYTYDDKFQ